MKPVQFARAPFSQAVFICRKCTRKAGAKRFRKEIKQAFKDRGTRRLRVIEAGCFDLCPRKRIVMAYSEELSRRRLLVVPPEGAAEAVAAILADQQPTA